MIIKRSVLYVFINLGCADSACIMDFMFAAFILYLPCPDPCADLSIPPTERDRLRPSTHCATVLLDYLAALSHVYATPRVETGQ